MIDEIETTSTETETAPAFDLEAAMTSYVAERDQRLAAAREAKEQAEREITERGCAEIWERVTAALPDPAVRAAFGITGASWDRQQESFPEVHAQIGGRAFRINPFGGGFRIVAPGGSGYPTYEMAVIDGGLLAALVAAAVWQRERGAALAAEAQAQTEESGIARKAASAKTWEPQRLAGDDYRATYLLKADPGCGSLVQHELTVVEINRAGDVTVSQMFPGRVSRYGDDDGAPKAVVEWRMSGAQLHALWPLWQQMTQEMTAATTEAATASDSDTATYEDIPL